VFHTRKKAKGKRNIENEKGAGNPAPFNFVPAFRPKARSQEPEAVP
jgi:hypothetical protein